MATFNQPGWGFSQPGVSFNGQGGETCCSEASLTVSAGGVPIITFGGCGCDCGSGSGSDENPLWFEITCLDEVCFGADAQYTCPTSQLPNNWCVTDFGSTNPSSRCARLFDATGINLTGDLCLLTCAWGATHLVDPAANPTNCLGGYELALALVCKGANPLSIGGADAPDNGVMLSCQIDNGGGSIAKAQYFIAADDFDCSGNNVLVLLGSADSTNENWGGSIVIYPCSPNPNNPSLCE